MSYGRVSASNLKERDCVQMQMEMLAVGAVEKDWKKRHASEKTCVFTQRQAKSSYGQPSFLLASIWHSRRHCGIRETQVSVVLGICVSLFLDHG